jgi:hypothetical protein
VKLPLFETATTSLPFCSSSAPDVSPETVPPIVYVSVAHVTATFRTFPCTVPDSPETVPATVDLGSDSLVSLQPTTASDNNPTTADPNKRTTTSICNPVLIGVIARSSGNINGSVFLVSPGCCRLDRDKM